MIILDKTNPPSPLYVRHEKPTFKNQYAFDAYWDEERRRWHEGYSGITGIHYLYLQELKLLTITGELIRPKWRETDSLFFDAWDKTVKDHWDMMLVKRTELGFSSMAGAAIPIHTMLTNPGSKCIMTSADDERRRVLFDDKLIIAFDNLDDDIRPNKARTRAKGQQDLFLANEDRVNKTFSGLRSRTIGIDTVKNPTAFEAHRAMYILIDELFLHPKARTAKAAAARRLVQGSKKIASMLFGGTVGDITTAGGNEALEIYKSSQETRVNVIYLGGTRGMDEFMINGWDDIEAGERWRNENLNRLAKASDKTEYFKFLTDYPDPNNIEAVFNLVKDCRLPQEVQHELLLAERQIEQEGIKHTKYYISIKGTKIQADPDEVAGKIDIVKPPIIGHTYLAGTDPIPFVQNATDDGSDYSIIILDDTTKEFVAHYTKREYDPSLTVRNSVLLQKLYKSEKFPQGAPTMMEMNRGEVVAREYIAQGYQNLLAPMPIHLGIVFEERKQNEPFGFYMNNHMMARCNAYVMKFLIANAGKMRLKELIRQSRSLMTKTNTDLLDAAKGALLWSEELAELSKIEIPQYVTHKVMQLIRNPATGMVERKEVLSEILER